MTPKRTKRLTAKKPLKRGTKLKPGKPLSPISADRLKKFGGRMPRNSLDRPTAAAREPKPHKAKARYTGPKRWVCKRVDERSGRMCEWPGCTRRGVERHHRLNRKIGGRHGEIAERLNGPAWLLKVCRPHHRAVTSAFGEQLAEAKAWGWVLTEDQDAHRVPVMTRHDEEPVWFLPDGSWITYLEGAA